MEKKSICIVGAGAIGGYYGALLQRAGFTTRFLARSDASFIARQGLTIESKNGNFTLPHVEVYRYADHVPPCDWTIVALKTTANAALAEILPRVTKPGGTIITLQNGLGAEETALAAAPGRTVIGGLCFICSNKVGPGRIRHLDYGAVTLGQFAPEGEAAGITPELEAVTAAFTAAGVEATPVTDLVAARWKKLVWNMPFNGLSALLDATTDRLMGTPALRELAEAMMLEVAVGSAAYDRPIERAFIDRMLAMTESMAAYAPSMLLDRRHARPMELEALYAEPLRRAAAKGIPMPRLDTLYRELLFVDG